jgi:hypothetical protein
MGLFSADPESTARATDQVLGGYGLGTELIEISQLKSGPRGGRTRAHVRR